MLTATFFSTAEEADRELKPCSRPCSDCSPGHHWYSTGGIRTHSTGNWQAAKYACRHCPAEAWIDLDADDLPDL